MFVKAVSREEAVKIFREGLEKRNIQDIPDDNIEQFIEQVAMGKSLEELTSQEIAGILDRLSKDLPVTPGGLYSQDEGLLKKYKDLLRKFYEGMQTIQDLSDLLTELTPDQLNMFKHMDAEYTGLRTKMEQVTQKAEGISVELAQLVGQINDHIRRGKYLSLAPRFREVLKTITEEISTMLPVLATIEGKIETITLIAYEISLWGDLPDIFQKIKDSKVLVATAYDNIASLYALAISDDPELNIDTKIKINDAMQKMHDVESLIRRRKNLAEVIIKLGTTDLKKKELRTKTKEAIIQFVDITDQIIKWGDECAQVLGKMAKIAPTAAVIPIKHMTDIIPNLSTMEWVQYQLKHLDEIGKMIAENKGPFIGDKPENEPEGETGGVYAGR